MTMLSWTVPMYRPEPMLKRRMDRQELWLAMIHKAEDPSEYVPYITSCEILEQYEDGLLREITYADRKSVRERVIYEPPTRMTFQAYNDPDVTEIVNEISADGDGWPTFTLRVTLTAEAQLKGQTEPDFLPSISKLFSSSLLPIVQSAVNGNLT